MLTKGHAGVAILPALLALVDGARAGEPAAAIDGREFLTCLVLGYEIATRAGIALHATVPDYHCSGAWNALGCAAVAARLLALRRRAASAKRWASPSTSVRAARSCAPATQPTMVKDGSGWGAHAGVSAALLARDGFTGAPALTVERDDARAFWSDLGTRWRIREQYFKAYPGLPLGAAGGRGGARAAARARLRRRGRRARRDRELPRSDRARLGCAIAGDDRRGAVQPAVSRSPRRWCSATSARAEIERAGARRSAGARLQRAMTLTEDADFSRRFPAERWARVRITLADGRTLVSEPARARGNPENPLSDDEMLAKYRALAEPVLGRRGVLRIEALVHALAGDAAALPALLDLLLAAPRPAVERAV